MKKNTKEIKIGNCIIGNGNPVLIQSMTKTKTQDVKATVAQILELEAAGCDIIRSAVPDMEAAEAIKKIKELTHIPFVADIHFDYRLAIAAIKNGADKIRINPGNIGSVENVKKVIDTAKKYEVPIRIGVNSGSLEKDILEKYGRPTAEALVESAMRNVGLVEAMDFDQIVVSIKSSDVRLSIDSYMKFAEQCHYPTHIGITEAGSVRTGTIKSAVGLGILLDQGIGDTIRVSLTGDPVEEIITAKEILKSLNLIEGGVELVSCPTCGRCNVNVRGIIDEVEHKIKKLEFNRPMKIAVMGCAVNGPGEAKDADIGIAGGNGEYLLFVKGQAVKKLPQENIVEDFIQEVMEYNHRSI